MQYRSDISGTLAKKLEKLLLYDVVFTTRKLKTCLPSLKCRIPAELQSNVVHEIKCPGCDASYAGQTVRHLTTRMREHAAQSTPVGNHTKLCCNLLPCDIVKIIDKCGTQSKLLTFEALHIARGNRH